MTFTTAYLGLYAVGYNAASFSDVAAGAWYHDAVSFIAAHSVTTGTGGGSYSPHAKLTRGAFIVMLTRAYDIPPDANSADNFADAGNTYYTNHLAAAKHLGTSGGVGNDLFAPEAAITRQEMFTLLYNALKVLDQLPTGASDKSLSDFTDAARVASWAKEAMTTLVEAGAVSGRGGKLSPVETATRAEAAQVLYLLLSE